MSDGQPTDPPDTDIARLAYERYEARGRADGHDLEDWLSAEQEARLRQAGIPDGAAAAVPGDDTAGSAPRRRARDRSGSRSGAGGPATPQVTM